MVCNDNVMRYHTIFHLLVNTGKVCDEEIGARL